MSRARYRLAHVGVARYSEPVPKTKKAVKPKPRKRGRPPKALKLEGDWQENVRTFLRKPKG